MRLKRLIIISTGLILIACSTIVPKKEGPEFHGVDERLQPLVDEFFHLSAENNIVFSNTVSIGIKDIEMKGVAGLCWRGSDFREIEISRPFWEYSSFEENMALVFHELIHCYCERTHDYRYGEKYESLVKTILGGLFKNINKNNGLFEDGCPESLMYPMTMRAGCFSKRREYYLKEMFNRCNPY